MQNGGIRFWATPENGYADRVDDQLRFLAGVN